MKRILPYWAALLLLVCAAPLDCMADDGMTSPVVVRRGVDYHQCFDAFDSAYRSGNGREVPDNSKGRLAWLESYLLQAYMEMYRATGDRRYLRSLCSRFDAMLQLRDDRLGRFDDYTSTALAGWGSSSYNRGGARWHVFIVHTGMITLGPAEFARTVAGNRALQEEFGTSASAYRNAIDECIRDAERYWRPGPCSDEGYYVDPAFGLLPLNQSNALGCVLLELSSLDENTTYAERAGRLARFFRNRLRLIDDRYEWAYWPREADDGTGAEDISHAAINVLFAVRCAQEGIVFNSEDVWRFTRTWLDGVRRSDGTWGGTVRGTGDSARYMPASAGRWLVLCDVLSPEQRIMLCSDVARAFQRQTIERPSQALGIAHLLRFCGH